VTGTVWAGAVWAVEPDGVEPPPEDPEPTAAVLRFAALPGTAVAGIDPTGDAPGVVGTAGVPVGAPIASTIPPVEVTSKATSVEPEAWTGALKAKVATIAQVAAMLRPPASARDAGATGPLLAFA
jgi:hypothetical protein